MIQIYHNPRCGKSRGGIEILENSGKDFEVIKYLEQGISKSELKFILKKLKMKPINIVRQNEPIWKEQFKGKIFSDDEIIEALILNPILIERPIVINGDSAVIGRPPENIRTII